LKKEELLKLLEQIPNDAEIGINEISLEGQSLYKAIEDVRYDSLKNVWIIE